MNPENQFEVDPAQRSFWRAFFNLPNTRLGFWSLGLSIAFFAFLGLFYSLVAAGQRGGDTFFSNPWLTIPIVVAALSAISAGVISLVAFFWKRERSIFGFLAFLLGLVTFWFVIGEIVYPH